MIQLFQMGGMLFMSILTIALIAVLVLTVRYLMLSTKRTEDLELIRSAGLLALVLGILGQMIGLYTAFETIEKVGSVSQAILAGGIKVSSITTIYGLVIFTISLMLFAGLRNQLVNR